MGVGRVLCVSLPFILTTLSLICLLIVGLAGVTSSNLSLFEVDPKDLSISIADLDALNLGDAGVKRRATPVEDAIDAIGGVNITAAQLNFGDKYSFFLWNYVEVRGDVKTKSAPEFDYASNFTDTSSLSNLTASTGVTVSFPDAVKTGLQAFATLIKWTQVVFIIACGAAAVTILVGLIGFCSRIGSCVTWIVSGISTVAIIAFAALATVTASTVVGVLTASLKNYGVKSSINTSWLAIVWLGAAASLASGLFWLFTVCCCASTSNKHRSRGGDSEKLVGGKGYQPVQDPFRNEPYGGQQPGAYNQQQYAIPMGNVKTNRAQAYEPYSHHAV